MRSGLRAARPPLAALAAALLSCACDETGAATPSDAGVVDFTLGAVALHLSSGAVRSSGPSLSFFLSDNPQTCQAITNVPNGLLTRLRLDVAPPLDGTARASVVVAAQPGAGQAVGSVVQSLMGRVQATLTASDGTLSWTKNGDGTVTIDSIDVGFSGVSGRVATGGLILQACP